MRVLIVDDHEVVRVGLRALLGRHQDLEVVGEASDAAGAVEAALRLRPDVVVMDIRLGGSTGIEACAEIRKKAEDIHVIMLTSYAEDELLFEAIEAGAAGYVLKQVGSTGLIDAIATVGRGESLLDQSLTGRLFARVRQGMVRERKDAVAGLTEQEMHVLAILGTGRSNKEIGSDLCLSEKTVRNYVSSILAKLNVRSRTEAAAYAARHHIDELIG